MIIQGCHLAHSHEVPIQVRSSSRASRLTASTSQSATPCWASVPAKSVIGGQANGGGGGLSAFLRNARQRYGPPADKRPLTDNADRPRQVAFLCAFVEVSDDFSAQIVHPESSKSDGRSALR